MQTVFSYRVVENTKIVSPTYFTPCMSAGLFVILRGIRILYLQN